jgi:small subunit ribosomal protein S6
VQRLAVATAVSFPLRERPEPDSSSRRYGAATRFRPRGGEELARHYEAMYIVDADTPDENLDEIIEKYKKVVVDAGGEVSDVARWEKGRRSLAYEIKKKREGMYLLMQFTSNTEVPKELDRIFKINDDIMRHLIVRQDHDEE